MNTPAIKSRTLLTASLLLLPAAGTLQAVTTFHNFNSDPNISTAWTNNAYYGATGTAVWNGTTGLNLADGDGDRWSMMSPNGGTRGASDTVTIDITALTATAVDWSVVGLAISDNANIALVGDPSAMYRFHLQKNDLDTDWKYIVASGNNNLLFFSSPFAFTSPITLSIERNGDNYDFKANGSTLYTGSAYTSAVHDAMDYYHITWGNGGTPGSSMTATVDNFGVIPEPGTALLGSLGMLALLRRRR